MLRAYHTKRLRDAQVETYPLAFRRNSYQIVLSCEP